MRARLVIILTMNSDEILPSDDEASSFEETSKSRFSFSQIRKGQYVRLLAVAIALIGIVLYLALPQLIIAYKHYSNTTTAGERDYLFPSEYISGILNLFGNGYFSYYKKSNLGPEVLVSQHASFNFFALGLLIVAAAAIGMTLWLNFTAKNEKWSKLTGLLYVIAGMMCFMGPIFFLVTNGFGSADTTRSNDIANYWIYDSLYVHDAYGAIVTGLVFFLGAGAFGLGTNLEGGDKNDIRSEE